MLIHTHMHMYRHMHTHTHMHMHMHTHMHMHMHTHTHTRIHEVAYMTTPLLPVPAHIAPRAHVQRAIATRLLDTKLDAPDIGVIFSTTHLAMNGRGPQR